VLTTVVVGATALVAVMLIVGPGEPIEVKGTVHDEAGYPVAGATVRVQATETFVTTDREGRFTVVAAEPGAPVRLTAWSEGYFITGGEAYRPGDDVRLVLARLDPLDHPGYRWLSVSAAGEGEGQGCAACHSREGIDIEYTLPVDEWAMDAHGTAATNPRFVSMYLGTDLSGNQSPPTRFVTSRDYGRIPLRPDPSAPYSGPGYRLDFPESQGNCAACHTPMASIDDPYGVDPTAVAGVAAEGIGCDFCHKVWDVAIDETSGLPDPNRPGVLSFEFRRPAEGHQFFAGPFDDVAPGEDTYSALQTESRFCAPCHFGVFWDTVVYNSFGEWLDSPYSDPRHGRTCQDCHMPSTGAPRFALPEAGGLERDPDTIRGHLMPGAADPELLQNALTMTVQARLVADGLVVDVDVVNDLTGHHVPTDSPLRHVMLLVEATDSIGALELLEGPLLPDWCGVGDPGTGHYAGLPGTVYAKVLEELWTEVAPSGAYWNQTRILTDTRIPALGSDRTQYLFAGPSQGTVNVEVTLVFRRAFIELAAQKGWAPGDVVMERHAVTLAAP
jgi:mono/diheme cytochrome c family protein